jgi:hypothetical protein
VVVLSSGGSGVAKLEPMEDANAIAALGAKIVVRVSQPDALVQIDGKPRDAMNAIAIAPGAHHLRVERTGYLAWERDVDVPAGATSSFDAELEPTPETAAARDDAIASGKKWGTIEVVSGSVLTAAGIGLFVWYAIRKSNIDSGISDFDASKNPGGFCDGRDSTHDDACKATQSALSDDRTRNDIRLGFAIGSTALGLASLGLGIYTLSKTPSSKKTATTDAPTIHLGGFTGPSSYGLTLTGAF